MQRPGIEPGPPAWQARILPLNQRCLNSTLLRLDQIIWKVWSNLESCYRALFNDDSVDENSHILVTEVVTDIVDIFFFNFVLINCHSVTNMIDKIFSVKRRVEFGLIEMVKIFEFWYFWSNHLVTRSNQF